jgi:hypothetical protein
MVSTLGLMGRACALSFERCPIPPPLNLGSLNHASENAQARLQRTWGYCQSGNRTTDNSVWVTWVPCRKAVPRILPKIFASSCLHMAEHATYKAEPNHGHTWGRGAMVPLAGIEPALLAELDFESSASTNSATGACRNSAARPRSRSGRNIAGGDCRSTRVYRLVQKRGFRASEGLGRSYPRAGGSAHRLPPRYRHAKHPSVIPLRLDSATLAG